MIFFIIIKKFELLFFLIYFVLYILKKQKLSIQYKANRIEFLIKKNFYYNESNLLTIQDKINWLLIHDTNNLKGNCADKILLHNWSILRLGKDICNRIIKIYKHVDDINFEELPEKFVLKTNHGSSFNIIIDNKTNCNITSIKEQLLEWLKIDYGKNNSEFHYSIIERKVFVEKYMGLQLKNYKFLCYNGKPKYVYLSIKKGEEKFRNFYDMDWNLLDFNCLSYPDLNNTYNRPNNFELMKKYAIILSKNFKFVRVDMYEIANEVLLGELTFSPMNSLFFCQNKSHEIELGRDIPLIIK